MTQLTPMSSERRRCSLISTHAMGIAGSHDTRATKRRRLSPPTLEASLECDAADPVPTLLTPPKSAKTPRTLSLRLIIPYTEPSKEEQRTLAIRRSCARRWQTKLQRPFPLQSEIKQAYKLKLMRHYPNTLITTEPDFVKPRIDFSPRVDRLLRRFPLPTYRTVDQDSRSDIVRPVYYYQALSTRARDVREAEASNISLQYNMTVTASEYAQRLAWKNFSTTERNRIDRGREAMLQSGLRTDDLDLEVQGRRNKLPEWRKKYTSRFLGSLRKNNV
jgi:hypothetical protein